MKICITSAGNILESQVDPRFGRCANFIIFDTETSEFEVLSNPNIDSGGGAGIQSGQLMASKNVKVLLTGNVGPNAFETLNQAGIKIYSGISGTVKDAIEKFQNGGLQALKKPSVGSKSGLNKNNL